MFSRRKFLQSSILLSSGLYLKNLYANDHNIPAALEWFMPDEATPHERTWMAFGADKTIWGKRLFKQVQRDLITIAETIADYEPVTLLVREQEYDFARKLITHNNIELMMSPLDDLWVRDTGCTFVVTESGDKAGIDFNFNAWGEKQPFSQDAKIAKFMAQQAGVKSLPSDLILEGGAIEVDGQGTAIISESCVLNNNRNPKISKSQCEDELMPLLGLDKIIWLKGIKGRDITDGHTDFYARFARSGVVLAAYDPDTKSFDHEVTLENIDILSTARDAQGNLLEVIQLEAPMSIRADYETYDFAAGYIGFYLCNNAVIMQQFGDKKADTAAKKTLQQAFPDRKVIAINIDAIAAGGAVFIMQHSKNHGCSMLINIF